jgi:type IV pilus assembly protein PilA
MAKEQPIDALMVAEHLRMDKQQGFTLAELLITVTILLILAAIAIPNFLRARLSANEASAVASMHSIDTAEISYSATFPQVGYASDLNTLGPGPIPGNQSITQDNACLLDAILGCTAGVGTASCPKSGYQFNIAAGSGTPITTYTSYGNPTVHNQTGTRYFYSDNSSVIRYNTSTVASLSDLAIQ